MEELLALAQDWLAPLGQVTGRKMMGGMTLYLDGVVFAILADDLLWFKADKESDAEWDAAGCDRFVVGEKDGVPQAMNYRRAPGDVYDDPEDMRRWAVVALAAGLRSAAKKRPRPRR